MTAHNVNGTMRDTTPQALEPDGPGQYGNTKPLTVFHRPQEECQGTRKDKTPTDQLLAALQRNYCRREPPELSDSIAMEPTGVSRRLGQ